LTATDEKQWTFLFPNDDGTAATYNKITSGTITVPGDSIAIAQFDGTDYNTVRFIKMPKTGLADDFGESVDDGATQRLVTALRDRIDEVEEKVGKAEDWEAGTYASEQTAVKDGLLYRVKTGVPSTTGEPGVSEDWEVLGKAVDVVDEFGESTEKAAAQILVSETIPKTISDFTSKIDGKPYVNLFSDGYLNLQNEVVTGSSYTNAVYTNYFDVQGVSKIYYKGSYGSLCAGLVYFDGEGTIIGVLSKENSGSVEQIVDPPAGAVTCRASSLTGIIDISFPEFGVNPTTFKDIQGRIGKKSIEYFIYDGYTRYSDGMFIEQSDWKTTDFMLLEDFVEANIWGHASQVSSVAFFYEKDQNSYLGGHRVSNTRVLVKRSDLNPPIGTRYIRVSTSGGNNFNEFNGFTFLVKDHVMRNRELIDKVKDQAYNRSNNPKFMHMSFDDVLFLLRDLTLFQSNYESIFDNPFLEVLKRLHDVYGAVFSMYCFCEDINTAWTISEVTNKFAEEFSDNSDWLKFGFHSKNSTINYADTTAWYARTDYTTFINAVYHMTGDIDCIDRAVRLHNFAGNLESCEAMRDEPCGITGLLAADDNKNSYYLTESFLRTHDRVRDNVNHLDFFKTETRLENATITDIDAFLAQFKTPARANTATEMIMFTHENKIYPAVGGSVTVGMVERIEACLRWGYLNGYTFDFPMNRI